MAVDYVGIATMVGAFGAFITTAVNAFISLRNGWKADRNAGKADLIATKVDEIHQTTNGLSDKLVVANDQRVEAGRIGAEAIGFEKGRQAEKKDQAANG